MSEPQYLTLHEMVNKARQNLSLNTWDYLVGGTATEATLRRSGVDALFLVGEGLPGRRALWALGGAAESPRRRGGQPLRAHGRNA